MTNTTQATALNLNIAEGSDHSQIAHLLDVVKIFKERFVLPDYNAVLMNLEDYEDMLFNSSSRIQKEIKQELAEYKKTGEIDYMKYRKERFQQ